MTTTEKFKHDYAGKYVWYTGGDGLTDAVLNNRICETYEEAVKDFSDEEGVSQEDIKLDHKDWYYIQLIDEIEDEYIKDALSKAAKFWNESETDLLDRLQSEREFLEDMKR